MRKNVRHPDRLSELSVEHCVTCARPASAYTGAAALLGPLFL
jgi:hypothetical protein